MTIEDYIRRGMDMLHVGQYDRSVLSPSQQRQVAAVFSYVFKQFEKEIRADYESHIYPAEDSHAE